MEKQAKILVTGSTGLIGSALVRLLKAEGYENVLTPSSDDVDFRQAQEVDDYFLANKPDYVFHLAASVGGIQENQDSAADFIYNNTTMHCNVLNACRFMYVKKVLFPGSACAYPALDRPIKEKDFLTGMPEPTNIAYAVAKINGIVMAQSYAKQYGMNVVLPMVANTYGIGDRSTHVIPMMIERFRQMAERYSSKDSEVKFMGTGSPLREFIYADDVASAFLFLMLNYDNHEIINVGTGDEISIEALAHLVANTIGYKGVMSFDHSGPDGVARKFLNSSRLRAMGWEPKVSLEEGLRRVISDYK